MVIWLYGKKAVRVSHLPAKFCGNSYCGSGDIMVLVGHVACQD